MNSDRKKTSVVNVLEQMPEKERKLLEEARVLEFEHDGNDEILTVARVGMFAGSAGSLSLTSGTIVATPARIIVFVQESCGGGTVVVPYSDIVQISLVGGNKKLFGRYEDVYILISKTHGGDRLQWAIGHDKMWGRHAAATIIKAHGSFAEAILRSKGN